MNVAQSGATRLMDLLMGLSDWSIGILPIESREEGLPFLQARRGWSGVRPDDGRRTTRTDVGHSGRDRLIWGSGDQGTDLPW